MSDVYVVIYSNCMDCDGGELCGVFSTREQAERAADLCRASVIAVTLDDEGSPIVAAAKEQERRWAAERTEREAAQEQAQRAIDMSPAYGDVYRHKWPDRQRG